VFLQTVFQCVKLEWTEPYGLDMGPNNDRLEEGCQSSGIKRLDPFWKENPTLVDWMDPDDDVLERRSP
jgi:hypothetical protein